jgi:hypothetical protein
MVHLLSVVLPSFALGTAVGNVAGLSLHRIYAGLMHVGAFGIAYCIKSTSSPLQLLHTATCSLTSRVLLWRADSLLPTR